MSHAMLINAIIALGAWAAVLCFIVFDILRDWPEEDREQADDADGGEGKSCQHQPPRAARITHHQRWHPEQRHHHRRERRYWVVSLSISFLGFCGALAAILIAREALNANLDAVRQATRAANEAHNQAGAAQAQLNVMQDAQRPWVANTTADPISPFVVGPDDRSRLTVRFMIKNTGHYPAFHVLVVAEMFVRSFSAREMSEARLSCAKARYRRLDRPPTGVTLFPEEQQPLIYNFIAQPADLEKLKATQTPR